MTDIAQTIVQWLANAVGVSATAAGLIIILPAMVGITIGVYLASGSMRLAGVAQVGFCITGVFVGLVPLWVALLSLPICFVMVTYRTLIAPEGEVDTIEPVSDRWVAYGRRLKAAYAAKFGGQNPGFNSEVDYRIEVMQNLRHGFSRTIAQDWLRRMERFTEVKL